MFDGLLNELQDYIPNGLYHSLFRQYGSPGGRLLPKRARLRACVAQPPTSDQSQTRLLRMAAAAAVGDGGQLESQHGRSPVDDLRG